MKYLHTMLRVSDLESSLKFWCNHLGMVEINHVNSTGERFTPAFLAADENETNGTAEKAPLLELTYNWPDDGAEPEVYSEGQSFGHLAFVVDDIYATCQRLTDAGVVINRAFTSGYGTRSSSPRDTKPNVGHW